MTSSYIIINENDNLIEIKDWARSTIDNLFSNNEPVSFEPVKLNLPTTKRRSISLIDTRKQNKPKIKRPWSSMSLTNPNNNKQKEGIHIWKNTFSSYLSSNNSIPKHLNNNNQILNFILNELITTENTYHNHLIIIKRMFMDPLIQILNKNLKDQLIINLKEIHSIFEFIPELITLSSVLVDELKQSVLFGRVFCQLEDQFEIYIKYAANFSYQQKLMSKLDKTNIYKELLQDSLHKKETNKMELSDYMIAPIQRITRYGLLLKDILKHSDPSNPDFPYIHRSLKCHLALAHAMNEIQ